MRQVCYKSLLSTVYGRILQPTLIYRVRNKLGPCIIPERFQDGQAVMLGILRGG